MSVLKVSQINCLTLLPGETSSSSCKCDLSKNSAGSFISLKDTKNLLEVAFKGFNKEIYKKVKRNK